MRKRHQRGTLPAEAPAGRWDPHHSARQPVGDAALSERDGSSRKPRGPTGLVQQVGLLTAIPFVLLVGPVAGYYLGAALDARWSHAPWGVAGGIVLGLVASARVTMQFIRQAKQVDAHE